MRRRVYSIRGFDCPSCASKCEAHLAKHPKIGSARIDYLSQRLYLTYPEGELTVDEIKAVIKEVEDDPIEIDEPEAKKKKGVDKEKLSLILRIAYCLVVFLLCGLLFRDLYWVRFGLYLSALAVIEYDILLKVAGNLIHRRNPLDEYLLISVASIGAFVLASLKYAEQGSASITGNGPFLIEEHFEAVLVCLLWQVGELLQDISVDASRKAIERAADSRVEEALLLDDDGAKRIKAKDLLSGDMVLVMAGSLIPVDGVVTSGEGYCDASSLTGESNPIPVKEGTTVYGGTLLTQGEVKVRATKDYASSASAKILDLVTSSMEKKGVAEKFITKFARWYTPAIFLFALVYLLIAGFVGPSWRSAVYTGLEIMVISCPCAIVISVPLAYFAAVGLASKRGVIVKGAAYLDELSRVNTVCLDKTGTLTKGRFALTQKEVDSALDEREFDRLLRTLEERSTHPLARTICQELTDVVPAMATDFESLLGYGVSAKIDGKTYFAGNKKMLEVHGLSAKEEGSGVYVYLFDETKVYGYVRLEDEEKDGSKEFLAELRKRGVEPVLLSGDKETNVSSFSAKMGIASYKAELLPEDKLHYLEDLQEAGQTVAFVGDGVNDAPCLKKADVGVAMGGLGADLAVEESDVILTRDDPMQILSALSVAKKCRHVIVFNIAFALLAKLTVLVLAMIFGERMPMEVAVLADTGMAVLLTVNSLLLLCRRN